MAISWDGQMVLYAGYIRYIGTYICSWYICRYIGGYLVARGGATRCGARVVQQRGRGDDRVLSVRPDL